MELEESMLDYLFITYIVTSKPKRISVAAGVVHMMTSFKFFTIRSISNKEVFLISLKNYYYYKN